MGTSAVVLLSGGLDSIAAMVWAQARYVDLRAVSCSYGQPNASRELASAKRAAAERGVPWDLIDLGRALLPSSPAGILGGGEPQADPSHDAAFVPGRNLLLAMVAAAHACTWWPGSFDVILGACAEDQAGFPDCRPVALAELACAIQVGCEREVLVRAPWADRTKREILYAIQPDAPAFDTVRRSWSCYRDSGPCGACKPCQHRARAFASLGVDDLCT